MHRGLPLPKNVDDLVLRGDALRTWSGPEGSSHSRLLQVPGVRLAIFFSPSLWGA